MQDAFYRQTAEIEERHWWFRHRRRLVRALLRRHGVELASSRVLDVGCGTGGNLRWLERHGASVVGVDRSPVALGIAAEKHPGSALALADATRIDECFAPASFDLVTVFNVLYHRWVGDVGEVLARLKGLLRPGGVLVASEPALSVLYRRHDQIGHGARRFHRRELLTLLDAAGLEPMRVVYFNVPGLPPALFLACLDRARGALSKPIDDAAEVTELRVPAEPLNRLVLALTGLERWWIRSGLPTPWGVTLLALARRPRD